MNTVDEDTRAERVAFWKSTIAVIVSLAILVGGGWFVFQKASSWWHEFNESDDYSHRDIGEEVTVKVPTGASLAQIGSVLVESDVVKTREAWGRAARSNKDATKIQPGQYQLHRHMPASEALTAMLDPKNRSVEKITFPEGLTYAETLKRIAETTGWSEQEVKEAAASIRLSPWSKGKPEGFLFPSTYQYELDEGPKALLQVMADHFVSVTGKMQLGRQAQQLKRDPFELVVIASIIEKETFRSEDRPKVARVIYNRLSKGMKLEMDSTVKYVVGKDGKVTTTDQDRANPSPYNTYNHQGLPPGPIANPGEESLAAAGSPAAGDWLFFVTVNLDTGETKFATTEAEHQQYVKEFQAWCQANPGRC